jgi:hypothetical protein
MIYRQGGKKWTLPDVVVFEGDFSLAFPKFTFVVLGYRRPKKGEHYLSGAIPQAYIAPNDLSSEYLVVRKNEKLVLRQVWVPEKNAKLNGEQVILS